MTSQKHCTLRLIPIEHSSSNPIITLLVTEYWKNVIESATEEWEVLKYLKMAILSTSIYRKNRGILRALEEYEPDFTEEVIDSASYDGIELDQSTNENVDYVEEEEETPDVDDVLDDYDEEGSDLLDGWKETKQLLNNHNA